MIRILERAVAALKLQAAAEVLGSVADVDETQAWNDARDAASFRALLRHCSEMEVSFTRDNRARQIKFVIKASTLTSDGYRELVRTNVEELAMVGHEQWPGGD